ncbi:hypothetical protein [Streptomyces chartreusis]
MDAEAQDVFRKLAAHRSSALVTTGVLPSGGDSHAGEDLLRNALTQAAGRLGRIDEPEAYVRQIMYRQQVNCWQLQWPRRGLPRAEPPQRGARRPLLARLRTIAPELASSFSPHEAQQARRADYSPMELSEPAATFIGANGELGRDTCPVPWRIRAGVVIRPALYTVGHLRRAVGVRLRRAVRSGKN